LLYNRLYYTVANTYNRRRRSSAKSDQKFKKMQKEISPAGNRTPASCELYRMTSRNTDHYTTEE
jgi:hypothetical protein